MQDFFNKKDGGMEEKRKHKVVILRKLQGFEQTMIPFTFNDCMSSRRETIFIPSEILNGDAKSDTEEITIFKNFITPLILSGKKAYIVMFQGERRTKAKVYRPAVKLSQNVIPLAHSPNSNNYRRCSQIWRGISNTHRYES